MVEIPAVDSSGDVLTDLVNGWVRRTPDAVAVIDEARTVTYRQLDERAGALANWLCANGVGIETRVAVTLGRSAEFIVAALAVLRAGGAYVPIDPEYPTARRDLIRQDCGATVVIDDTTVEARVADPVRPLPTVPAGALAYLVYTSGSTGRPKGVAVTHANVSSLLRADPRLAVTPGDRVAHLAPTSFDAATFEIWAPLCHGGTVVVLRDARRTARELGDWLRMTEPDWLFLTTGLFHLLTEQDPAALGSVGTVLCGGDVLSPAHVSEGAAAVGRTLYAAYGPTETTVFASLHEADPNANVARVPLGSALRGVRLAVLDEDMAVAGQDTTGEIHVSGAGVARGYHERPGLTAAHFLPDPHAAVPGARCYRTGDRGRALAGSEFEFHGRTDRQVKVNGFRVELGEIEATLAAHDQIGSAVVTVVTDAVGKRIVAHVAPVAGAELDAVALRAWLADRLPRHSRPHNYVVVPNVPLDANGKFRRDDLGDVLVSRAAQSAGLPPYQSPEPGLEALIAEAFVDVLAIDRVGAHDNFFEIGGDSLRSVLVLDRLRQHGIPLALRQFFSNATVAGLASLATGERGR